MKRTASIYMLAIIAVLAGIVALVDTTRYIVVLFIDLISYVSGTPIELLLPSVLISGLVLILGLLPSTRRAFGTDQMKD